MPKAGGAPLDAAWELGHAPLSGIVDVRVPERRNEIEPGRALAVG